MADENIQRGLMPSIIDRLIDPDEKETRSQTGYDMQDIVNAVRRDLEDLLNTHQAYTELSDDWKELKSSILVYGIPDFVSKSTETNFEKSEVGQILVNIINRFEPRLRNVKVKLMDGGKEAEHTLTFHVDAELNVDPAPEVSFETILELTTGHTRVRSSED